MSVKVKKFDAEVGKILNLVINSIYTNKDIFLRELISNASDACDKLRYQTIKTPSLINKNHKYQIQIEINKVAQTITISDSGLGMNDEELSKYLGRIASSGTQKFMEHLSNTQNSQLIGQFGVGFYSAFMVADKVEVFSKKAGEPHTYKWSSTGKNDYTVEQITQSQTNSGTQVVLHIKQGEQGFLDEFKLKQIITTYSDHIFFPITLINPEKKDQNEIINKTAALWQKPTKEISKKEYTEFFRHTTNLSSEQWLTIHNKIEGALEYTSLLFIPDTQPFDLLNSDRKTKIKLYINRVFISEDNNFLIPTYLRFLRGVVDSNDLPLNISRETLQNNNIVKKIRNSITHKVLNSLEDKYKNDQDGYNTFFKNFGDIIKEGLCGESTPEEKQNILSICRFYSSTSKSSYTGLDQYIERMPAQQKDIYFLNGDKIDNIQNHPQLEGFKKKGIEVLYLINHIDNFWVNIVRKYRNKDLKSITSNKINLDQIKKSQEIEDTNIDEKSTQKYKELLELIKNVLKAKVKDVVISSKLIHSPACIAIPEGSMNLRMEKFLIDQKQLHSKVAKILEINPNHNIWIKVNSYISQANKTQINKNIINVIYNEACLIEGDSIEDPNGFAEQLNSLLSLI